MGEKQPKYSLENELPSFEAPKKRKISFFKKKSKDKGQSVNSDLPDIPDIPDIPPPIEKKVHHSKKFKFANGKSARNIIELKENISSLGEVSLKKHVNKDKHEISEWVETNFKRPELAKQLKKSKSKKSIMKILEKHIEKETVPASLPDIPEFTNIQSPSLPKKSKPQNQNKGMPPRAPNKLGGRLANSLPSLDDELIPPEPTKDMLVKKQSLFGKSKKTIAEHQEIDSLITKQEEDKRHQKKGKFLFKKEKQLMEKQLDLEEIEKAQIRQDEKLYSLNKAFDHDVRERISNVKAKDEKLRDLKKSLKEEKKHYEEKDLIMDNLRQRYLDFIAKEANLEEKEKTLNQKQEGINDSITKLQKVNSSVDQKFEKLKELNTDIQTEWQSQFAKFENVKHLNELRNQELMPKISKLYDDILLFTHKEKILIKQCAELKDAKKQFKDLEKKKKETLNAIEKLKETNNHIDEKSSLLDKREKELNNAINKIKKTKELKENTQILKSKLSKVEERLSKASIKLLNFSELETKSLELDHRSKMLNSKAQILLKNLDKIEKNKDIKENTRILKSKLSKVEERLKEKTKELLLLGEKSQSIKDENTKLDARKAKVALLERQLKEEKKSISSKHKVYEKQMEDIMDTKFHSYLEKTIKKTTIPKDKDYKHNQIYVLIDNCKDLIDLGKGLEAKKLYNKIRSLFIELNLRGTEHQILKETIKDLYTQIKISSIR